MNKNPLERATIEQLIEDEWLSANGEDPIDLFVVLDTDSSSTNSEKLVTFAENKKENISLESLSECSSEDSCSSSSEYETLGAHKDSQKLRKMLLHGEF